MSDETDSVQALRDLAQNMSHYSSQTKRVRLWAAANEIDLLRAELARRSRGQCICIKCGLRQPGDDQQEPAF